MTEPLLPLDGPAPDPTSEPRERRFRWRRKLGLAAALLACLMAAAWWLPSPVTTETPVTWSRNPDGSFATTDSPPESGPLEIHAATVQASNSSSRASSSTHSGADFFPSASIAVLNLSDSLLMKRAADQLVEALKQDGDFSTVTHFPAGHRPAAGQDRSDLYLTLDLKRLEVSGLASRDIEADIDIQLGPSPVSSRHSYSGSLSPPTLNFHAHIELDHRSTLTGVESRAARFKLQGANIGNAIATQILQEINDRRKEERPMPALPAGFFPDWSPPPAFEFLTRLEAEQRLSFSGCCLINETLCQVDNAGGPEQTVAAVHAELSDTWQGNPGKADITYLRMTRDGESVEVFPRREGAFLGDESDSACWIRYRRVLDQSQREQLFESLLSETPPRMDLLLSLDRMGTRDQRERTLALADTHSPSTATAWLNLAGRYMYKKQTDKAVNAIRCAYLVGRIRSESLTGQINAFLKKHKLDKSSARLVTEDVLTALSFTKVAALPAAPESITRTISPGTLVGVYSRQDEQFHVSGLYTTPATSGTNSECEIVAFDFRKGSSSWTSGSKLSDVDWQQTFHRHTPQVEFAIRKADPTVVHIHALPAP